MMNRAVAKKLKTVKPWIVFVAISVCVWGLAFYWIAQPARAEKLEIWLGAEFRLKTEIKADIEAISSAYGMKECVANSYDPSDTYYAQAFSLRANSVDIYILDRDMAETLFETGIFKELEDIDGAEYLVHDEVRYGVKFVGDYYIFINSASKKDKTLLYDVIAVLIEAGDGL